MESGEYFAGISPGGLTDVYEIKILICYLLYAVQEPLTENEVQLAFQERAVVNYFAYREAMEALKESGHITLSAENGREVCKLEQRGIDTAEMLYSSLSPALRDRVVEAAANLLARRRQTDEVTVDCSEAADGFLVSCRMRDIGSDLMRLTLYAPDRLQAEQLARNLREHSAEIYQGIFAVVTRHRGLMEQSLSAFPEEENG